MTKQEALAAIKALRGKINDEADTTAEAEMWENGVLDALDRVSDLIEFPKE